jgi:hypothetical protein
MVNWIFLAHLLLGFMLHSATAATLAYSQWWGRWWRGGGHVTWYCVSNPGGNMIELKT